MLFTDVLFDAEVSRCGVGRTVAVPPPGIQEDLARRALFFRYSMPAPHIHDDLAQRAPLFRYSTLALNIP